MANVDPPFDLVRRSHEVLRSGILVRCLLLVDRDRLICITAEDLDMSKVGLQTREDLDRCDLVHVTLHRQAVPDIGRLR